MKQILAGFYLLLSEFIMWIPIWPIRWMYLKICLKSLGKKCYIARNVDIRAPWRITIGNNTIINKRVLLDGRGIGLIIGNNVDIAQDVKIWSLTHDINSPTHQSVKYLTKINDYVWIGANAIILSGVSIDKGAVIAAGAIVTKSVSANNVVGGNPSKFIKMRDNPLHYTLKHNSIY